MRAMSTLFAPGCTADGGVCKFCMAGMSSPEDALSLFDNCRLFRTSCISAGKPLYGSEFCVLLSDFDCSSSSPLAEPELELQA